MGKMKKKAGKNSKDAQIIKQYEKTMALTRKGWDAIMKFHQLPAVKAYLGARQPLKVEQPRQQAKDDFTLDAYDSITGKLDIVEQVLELIAVAERSPHDDMPRLHGILMHAESNLVAAKTELDRWYEHAKNLQPVAS